MLGGIPEFQHRLFQFLDLCRPCSPWDSLSRGEGSPSGSHLGHLLAMGLCYGRKHAAQRPEAKRRSLSSQTGSWEDEDAETLECTGFDLCNWSSPTPYIMCLLHARDEC